MSTIPFDDFDTSQWPVVKVSILRAPISDDDSEMDYFQAKFVETLELAANGIEDCIQPEKITIIMCLDGILEATFKQQLKAAALTRSIQAYVDVSIFCTAIVVENVIARKILEIITSLQPLKSVNRVFDNYADAFAWAHANRDRQLKKLPPVSDPL
jgi:hypothetical protein